jgi:hypothetical protein
MDLRSQWILDGAGGDGDSSFGLAQDPHLTRSRASSELLSVEMDEWRWTKGYMLT